MRQSSILTRIATLESRTPADLVILIENKAGEQQEALAGAVFDAEGNTKAGFEGWEFKKVIAGNKVSDAKRVLASYPSCIE